jgi:LuxR family transcriptional regulator, quorum-sensing system regulator CciR
MRHRNKAVRAFFADYRHYREIAELHQALDDVTKALGFCYFALLHHAHPAQSNTLLVHLHNYPPDWASRYAEEQLYRYDPVLEACSRTNIGFSWDEIDTLIRMTPRLRFTIDSAQENGLGNGFTVPAHVPGEPLGSCSFVTAAGVALPRDSLHIAELVGSFAFAAARRINASSTNSQRGYAALTPRQRDCVYWLSQGKTAWEIGVILGISQETVTQHLNMACARYGVGKRVPMVIKALYGGEIGFLDVIG